MMRASLSHLRAKFRAPLRAAPALHRQLHAGCAALAASHDPLHAFHGRWRELLEATRGEEDEVLYDVEGCVARITLNRPDRMNAITSTLPYRLRDAVARADADERVKMILLTGAGKGFCAGYDLKIFAETKGPLLGSQAMPWDPMEDFRFMNECTQCFMSLWRAIKPVVCKVQGYAVAGGSDIALCSDLVVMADDARIGYPPARIWGCPTTFMWVYRLGAEKAKRMLLTGDTVSGKEAAQMGLVSQSVPTASLDAAVDALLDRMSGVPANQLAANKLVVNQAYENMGMRTTQMLATLMDGIARHTPEGVQFKKTAEEKGFRAAVAERDGSVPIYKVR